MSSIVIALSVFVFWLGPPAAVLIAGAVMYAAKRHHAPGGPLGWGRFWRPMLAWGAAGAALWIAFVAVLLAVTRAGNAGLWIFFIPWACAAGEVVGFVKLRRTLYADRSPSA